MTTFMPFYEEVMTLFLTNNIQHGVNSHFHVVWMSHSEQP